LWDVGRSQSESYQRFWKSKSWPRRTIIIIFTISTLSPSTISRVPILFPQVALVLCEYCCRRFVLHHSRVRKSRNCRNYVVFCKTSSDLKLNSVNPSFEQQPRRRICTLPAAIDISFQLVTKAYESVQPKIVLSLGLQFQLITASAHNYSWLFDENGLRGTTVQSISLANGSWKLQMTNACTSWFSSDKFYGIALANDI